MLADGKTVISIKETPSFMSGSALTLTRQFSIQGLPQGQQVALQLTGDNSIWRVQGTAGVLRDRDNHHELLIRQNGKVTLLGTWKNL
jgi:hypothetical protein